MKRLRIAFFIACVSLATPVPHPKCAPLPTDGTVRVGDIAPDFTLPSLNGEPVHLQEQLGEKPVLLIFWSYFCFPCQKEMPSIQSVFEELGPDEVSVIGISLDGPEYDKKVRPFLSRHGITYPNVYDRLTEEFFEVAEHYGVVGTPTSFVLDPRGRIRFIHLGRLEGDVLKGVLKGAEDNSFCPDITRPDPSASP